MPAAIRAKQIVLFMIKALLSMGCNLAPGESSLTRNLTIRGRLKLQTNLLFRFFDITKAAFPLRIADLTGTVAGLHFSGDPLPDRRAAAFQQFILNVMSPRE